MPTRESLPAQFETGAPGGAENRDLHAQQEMRASIQIRARLGWNIQLSSKMRFGVED